MAARAFIERSGTDRTLRAVCQETGVQGPLVRDDDDHRSCRIALAMLSDACDCDDYHSVMETDARQQDPPTRSDKIMPDPNKLDALAAAGFKIQETCGLCKRGIFRVGSDWGMCSKIQYEHGKHTGASRDASVHQAGHCPAFELSQTGKYDLARSGFDRFVLSDPARMVVSSGQSPRKDGSC